jgi:hypothetical protein
MKLRLSFILLIIAFLATACFDIQMTPQQPAPTTFATLIPAFISTPQAAQAGAQATIFRAQAEMANVSLTATVVSMQMTMAAATDRHFIHQTEQAANSTVTAQAARATATQASIEATARSQQATTTQEAINDQVVATQRAHQATVTLEAISASIRSTATQSALNVIQARAAAEARSIERKSKAEAQTVLWRTWAARIFWAVVIASFFIILLYCLWTFRLAIFARLGLIRWGSGGKPYIMVPTAGGLLLMDMTRSITPGQHVDNSGSSAVGGIGDLALQAQVAARSQAAELLLAANTHDQDYPHIAQRQQAAFRQAMQDGKALSPNLSESPQTVIGESIQLPPVAPWNLVDRWHGRSLPLGVGPAGLITADPERTPHLLIAGTSGSGKTMTGLRPIAAYALACGYRVILLNDSGGDFAPLQTHINLIIVDQAPSAIAEALEYVAGEVIRRSGVLRAAGASTWLRLPPELRNDPPIMVVIDELVALAITADTRTRERIWRAAINITSKGRKMDVAFLAATTDPTYRTLGREGLIVRDNCGRIAFRTRDESTSRAMLDQGGAERLEENQFLAMLNGSLVRGVAFHPQDEDLANFIDSRPAPALPELTWIPGEIVETIDVIDLANRIRSLWQEKASKRAMARAVGETYAGAFCSRLDRAIEWLENSATTSDVAAIEPVVAEIAE